MDLPKIYPEGPTVFGMVVMFEMYNVFREGELSDDAQEYILRLADEVVKDMFDPSDIAKLKRVMEVFRGAISSVQGVMP